MSVRICWAIFVTLVLGLFVGCHSPRNSNVCPPDVEFSDLLADPVKYAGRRIRLTGFYLLGFEASVLYETAESLRRGGLENGVWVYWPKNDEVAEILFQHKERPVTIYGIVTCRSGGQGHLGLFKVGIDQIDRVVVLLQE
jgi:hypothetical protein